MHLVMPATPVVADPCGSCSTLYGATCCEVKGGGPLFPMTYGEAARISRSLKQPIEDCVVVRKVGENEQTTLRQSAGDRIADLVVSDLGLYLPHAPDGRCVYLKERCSIPTIKSYLCATFPFSYRGGGWSIGDLADSGYCFAQDTAGGSVYVAMKMFGTTSELLEEERQAWNRCIKSHPALMKKLKRRQK